MAFFESKLGPRLGQNLVQDFILLVSPNLQCISGYLKNYKQCVGVRKYFWAVCQGVKKGFSEKKALFVFVGKKRKYEKMKRNISKNSQKIVFLVVVKIFFAKLAFLKNGRTLFVFGKKKRAFSLQLPVFGKWHILCNHTNSPNTTKIGVSAGTWGKPKMAFLVSKVPFGVFPSKRASLFVIHKSCVLLKTLFYGAFSTTQLCRNKRV